MEEEQNLLGQFDAEQLGQYAESDAAVHEQVKQEEATAAARAAEIEAANKQALAEQQDPRNKEGWGVGAVAKEVGSALGGGVQDTLSSLVTLPERAIDMVTGEMQEEMKTEEGYQTEWDDFFVDDDNPIVTKTWWGGLLRGATHFGTMSLVLSPAAGAIGKASGAGSALAKIAGTGKTANLIKAAGYGAGADALSKYSQDDNALGMLRDQVGFMDTPLSTKDDDHPLMMTLKNVVEGMGIGLIFDGVRMGLKGASDVTMSKVRARNKDILDQSIEAGAEQLKEPGIGGYKNKDLVDSDQGAPTSRAELDDIKDSLERTRTEFGAEKGSTASPFTPSAMKRIANNTDAHEVELDKLARQFMSSERYAQLTEEIISGRTTLRKAFGSSLEMAQRTIEGRNTSNLTPEEFWAEFFTNVDNPQSAENIAIWGNKNIAAADMVIGSMIKQMRDLGIAAREAGEVFDINAPDGPVSALRDKILTGLAEVKRVRLNHDPRFSVLGADEARRVAFNSDLELRMSESRESLDLMLKLAGDSNDDDLLKSIVEVISMTDEVHNLTDFDNWVRKKFRGGEFNGKTETGILIKELQGVMVNSILSGPKTPMRAIMGTSTATFLRPAATALGAALRYPFTGDATTLRAGLASMNAMREAIPEAWTLFRKRLDSYWAGDISTVRSRFSKYTRGDERWKMYGNWVETSENATNGDKAAYYMANMARAANDNKFLTYSTKIMAATDDTFGYILARARAKELAVREALESANPGVYTDINPRILKDAENRFLGKIMDKNGNILDEATKYAKKEVTLTQDLTGFAKGMEEVFNKYPWTKPFFLFARTGVNGLALTAKHTPGFNFLVKEWNDIAFANPNNLSDVAKYGIETAEDLINAKALQGGRLALGSSVIMMASGHFMNGGLTGNGPTDRQKRQVWIDAGWQPRSIKIGDVWVGYDSFEPFNQILSTIADIGDHSELMGQEWTEQQFQKTSLVIAQAIASKSYLSGIQQFVDLFSGSPGQQNRIIASIANNTLPLSGLRNELGKLFNPHMKELNSGIGDAIRNRNLMSEGLAGGGALPTKYDMLNGKPVRDYDFPTRMWNAIIPIPLNLDQGPGRKLLFDSGYDLRTSTYYGPDGTDLTDSPALRSEFQRQIGIQNIELELNRLAKDPRVMASIAQMQKDLRNGNRDLDPMKSYLHNKLIRKLIQKARKRAWAKMRLDPRIQKLMESEKALKIRQNRRLDETSALLQMNR